MTPFPGELNPLGLAAALATFLSIWLGHVSVRKIEYHVARIWLPAAALALAGLALAGLSLWISLGWISAVCAIAGITLLWDALELYRQARRVRIGRAPANPRNPRHARHASGGHPEAEREA